MRAADEGVHRAEWHHCSCNTRQHSCSAALTRNRPCSTRTNSPLHSSHKIPPAALILNRPSPVPRTPWPQMRESLAPNGGAAAAAVATAPAFLDGSFTLHPSELSEAWPEDVCGTMGQSGPPWPSRTTIGLSCSGLTIDLLIPGGPAQLSGRLERGDVILAVDGQPIHVELLRQATTGSDIPARASSPRLSPTPLSTYPLSRLLSCRLPLAPLSRTPPPPPPPLTKISHAPPQFMAPSRALAVLAHSPSPPPVCPLLTRVYISEPTHRQQCGALCRRQIREAIETALCPQQRCQECVVTGAHPVWRVWRRAWSRRAGAETTFCRRQCRAGVCGRGCGESTLCRQCSPTLSHQQFLRATGRLSHLQTHAHMHPHTNAQTHLVVTLSSSDSR